MQKNSIKGRILDYVKNKGIEINNAGFILCPFHDDHNPSCKIYEKNFVCFSCGEKGDIYQLAAGLLGTVCNKENFPEICRDIEKTLGIPSEKWKPGRDFYNRNKMLDGRQMPPLSKSAVFREALLAEFAAAVDGGNMALAQDKAAFLFALYCLPDKTEGTEPQETAKDRELMRLYETIRKERV